MLTQSGAPGRVIDWTNFSHQHFNVYTTSEFSIFHWICPLYLLVLVGVGLPLCVTVTPS